ncbi:MAG: helix-turn-helix transcriptional regulator [Candidatus Hodarchaeota archaeon]
MKIISRIKDLRNELGLNQQDLADRIGVTRQTIYFLEKGTYNPSLTISFRIAEVLKKPLGEIFFQVPIIKEKIEDKSIKQVKEFAEKQGMDYELLVSMGDLDEKDLLKKFSRIQLEEIAKFLEMDFNDLFIDA